MIEATVVLDPLAVPMTQVSNWLGISRSKAYEEIAAGRLRAVKCGSKTLITFASGKAWLDALPAFDPTDIPGGDDATRRSAKIATETLTEWKASPDMIEEVSANILAAEGRNKTLPD